MSQLTGENLQSVLVFGEVLVDEFADGRIVVGGAPLNVAWNLKGFGVPVSFLSSIGDDPNGALIRQRLESWSLDSLPLQISENLPTGRVRIELDQGQPSYEIEAPAAYDAIQPLDSDIGSVAELGKVTLLYHGSLAIRMADNRFLSDCSLVSSRDTLRKLVTECKCSRFVDLNLRLPWFERDVASEFLAGATWVKLNDEELGFLAEVPTPASESEIRSSVDLIRNRYGGEHYLVTCGAKGAYAEDGNRLHFAASPTVHDMQDTVGAGDAFSATVIAALSRGQAIDRAIRSGVDFAARVCELRGATTTEQAFYRNFNMTR